MDDFWENPCRKKADFEEPNEVRMYGAVRAIEGDDFEEYELTLVWLKSEQWVQMVVEEAMEAIILVQDCKGFWSWWLWWNTGIGGGGESMTCRAPLPYESGAYT